MPRIVLETKIHAPLDRCFDLSRSIDLHKISTEHTNEEAIDGVTSGLISLNESVGYITATCASCISEIVPPVSV